MTIDSGDLQFALRGRMRVAAPVLCLLLIGSAAPAVAQTEPTVGVAMGPFFDEDPVLAPAPASPVPRARPDDKRRTLRSYGGNLAYNLLGVVTPGNHGPLIVTVALTAPAFAWDDEGVDYFRKHPHHQFGNIGAAAGGGIAVTGLTLGFFSAGRFARGDRFRDMTYDVSQAVIVNQVYAQALKFTFRRERPDGSNRQSFPSGHASNAFAVATVVARHYRSLRFPAYAAASYIALSRMAANKHYFSDIVAASGFGFGVGRVVVRRNSRPPAAGAIDTHSELSLTPDRGPAGDGRGLSLVLSF